MIATAPPSEMARCGRLPRLGFFGVGSIGRQRLASLATSGAVSIDVIADPCEGTAQAAARLAPGAAVARTLDELLAANLDGLVIATDGSAHAEQTVAAVEGGLAVFCQKPLARTGAAVRRVVDAARAADRLLQLDSFRYLTAGNALRRLVRSGELGHIYLVDAVFHSASGPGWDRDRETAGGGCLSEQGVHLLDLALWLLDAPSVSRASGRRYAGGRRLSSTDTDAEDYATARVDLVSGATISLACSSHASVGPDQVIRVALHGTRGGAALENMSGAFHDFRAQRYRCSTAETLSTPPDIWGGRAAVAWACQLAIDRRFDAGAERFVEVASILDWVFES